MSPYVTASSGSLPLPPPIGRKHTPISTSLFSTCSFISSIPLPPLSTLSLSLCPLSFRNLPPDSSIDNQPRSSISSYLSPFHFPFSLASQLFLQPFYLFPHRPRCIFTALQHHSPAMGFSEKPQLDGAAFDSDNNTKWVIAGIPLRAPLKPIYTAVPAAVVEDKPPSPPQDGCNDVVETDEYCCTTPTSEDTRIPTIFTCPPAPRKRKPSSSKFRRATPRRFFNPPDLESVFILAEKAN